MDEAQRREIQAWLRKALLDLHSAEWLLQNPHGLYNAVGFHSQQAAEKAIKAYLTWQEDPFKKTHSLVALVSQSLQFDESFEDLREAATDLTPYAVAIRYPAELPELTHDEATESLHHARQIWEFVLKRLPQETHPDE